MESKWFCNYDRATLKNPYFIEQIATIPISFSFLQRSLDLTFKLPKAALMKELMINSGLFQIFKFMASFFQENEAFLTSNIKIYLKIESNYIHERDIELEDPREFFHVLPILVRFLYFLEHFLESLNEPSILNIQDSKRRDALLNLINYILGIFTENMKFWQVIQITSLRIFHLLSI